MSIVDQIKIYHFISKTIQNVGCCCSTNKILLRPKSVTASVGMLLHDFLFVLIFLGKTNNSTTALSLLLLTTLVVVDRAPRLGLVMLVVVPAATLARFTLTFLHVAWLLTNGGAQGVLRGAQGVLRGAQGVLQGAKSCFEVPRLKASLPVV